MIAHSPCLCVCVCIFAPETPGGCSLVPLFSLLSIVALPALGRASMPHLSIASYEAQKKKKETEEPEYALRSYAFKVLVYHEQVNKYALMSTFSKL